MTCLCVCYITLHMWCAWCEEILELYACESHTYTYSHTNIPTRARTHTHTYSHTHIPTHVHTHTHTYSHTHIHAHTHMHTHSNTHIPTHTRTNTLLHLPFFFSPFPLFFLLGKKMRSSHLGPRICLCFLQIFDSRCASRDLTHKSAVLSIKGARTVMEPSENRPFTH